MKVETEITEIEQVIIQGMAEGNNDSMVAAELDMELSTMRNHKRVLMAKVGAINTANLVAIGFRKGIIK